MVELLKVLAEWLGFFFVKAGYRLIDSEAGASYGDAWIEFASDKLAWRIVRDRSQIFLECGPSESAHKRREWYSTDVLVRLITGRSVPTSELSEEAARWIEGNLADIEARFAHERLEDTQRELKRLERLRAKELFG